MECKLLGFEHLKELYPNDVDFKDLYLKCLQDTKGIFHIQEGFLFKENRLCVPNTSLTRILVREVHKGLLSGDFGIQKNLDMLAQHFYLPKML